MPVPRQAGPLATACPHPLLEVAQHPHMPKRGEMRQPNPGEAFIGGPLVRDGGAEGGCARTRGCGSGKARGADAGGAAATGA
eukprot:357450-Chlamydomonas_euryale.AAC.4